MKFTSTLSFCLKLSSFKKKQKNNRRVQKKNQNFKKTNRKKKICFDQRFLNLTNETSQSSISC